MSKPIRVSREQEQAFGRAVCERLGLDPAVVGDDIKWEVVAGEDLGRINLSIYLPAEAILAMWNGTGR